MNVQILQGVVQGLNCEGDNEGQLELEAQARARLECWQCPCSTAGMLGISIPPPCARSCPPVIPHQPPHLPPLPAMCAAAG